MMIGEQWSAVPGLDDIEVSTLGRVRKYLTPHVDSQGYLSVGVAASKTVRVHRIAGLAFLGVPPFPGAMVRHLNDKKGDNRLENLAWGTMKDNAEDAIRNNGSRRRLTDEQIEEVFSLWGSGVDAEEIGRRVGISRQAVHGYLKGKRRGVPAYNPAHVSPLGAES